MEYIKDICRGVLIGVANIVPGVSGGTLAVSMGIYDKLIRSVTSIWKDTKNSIVTLLPYGIGAAAGVAGLSFVIESLFNAYPFQTSMAFIGLIGGGLPSIFHRVRNRRPGLKGFLAVLAAFILITALTVLGKETAAVQLRPDAATAVSLACIGLIAAATMVIPGVSGSMILMMLGYYQPIIRTINDFLRSAGALDAVGVWRGGILLAPFGIGVIVGIFLCAKLVEYLFDRFESVTYCGVLGLVLSSPAAILQGIGWSELKGYQVMAGIALCLFLFVFASRLADGVD